MQPSIARRVLIAGILLSCIASIAPAHAQALTYGIDAGFGETDNVRLARVERLSQTFAVADLDLAYLQKSQRLDVNAKGDFSYFDYLQGAYGNQLLGRFDGKADIAVIPQQFTWVVQENFGQAAINPFVATTPTNLENINILATGPDLFLRMNGAGFFNVSARAIRTQYETSAFSGTRYTANLAWGHNLSALSSVSLNGDSERALFENTTLNSDFERSHVFGRYALAGARTELSADLGATIVGQSGESTTGALARFMLARKISASARLTFTLGHDVIDGATSFSALQAGATGVIGTAPATNTSQNYTDNYGSLNWDYQRNRTTLGISARYERDTYFSQSALDRTETSGELLFGRQLSRAFALQFAGRAYKTRYQNALLIGGNESPSNLTSSLVASIAWRHGRALEVKAAAEHTRYSTSPNDTGYHESRVVLTVGYRPFAASPGGQDAPAF